MSFVPALLCHFYVFLRRIFRQRNLNLHMGLVPVTCMFSFTRLSHVDDISATAL